ncbi:MAG TPA: HK97-gp10 family putative phage morphogenesis protein, partial [Chloroflexota bacterium]|nr:HK97-gp10 family putative phage morphogenesis protein [Chloroflexota bacterium]
RLQPAHSLARMADVSITVKISGLDELEKALETLPPKVARRVIRSSLKEAAGIWRGEMVRTVLRGWHRWRTVIERAKRGGAGHGYTDVLEFGVVSRLIGMQTKISPDGFAGSCSVGPVKKAFWAMFMEFGTGHEAARPFVRPAFESRKAEVADKFIEGVQEALEEEGLL